jgi:iduronate 2-sulfatase
MMMLRPSTLALISLTFVCVLGMQAADSTTVAASKTNVLFLICDDLNCDLGCYGHEMVRTPNIDRLADRGVKFQHAYCQYPLCGPSRASFMAGLYPDQTLVKRNAIYIREHVPNVLTLSQMFRKHDYMATRVGKIYHYNVPLHIGTSGHDDPYSWDYTINPRGRDVIEQDKIFSLRPGSYGGTLSWLAAEGTGEEQTDGIAATETIKLLERHAEERSPFFIAVGLYRPHTPYVAPKEYFDRYPLDKIQVPSIPEGYLKTLPNAAARSITRKKEQLNLTDELARQAIQAYYASISFADAQVGRILDALKETGLDKDTVVIFTSDHGYHMGEHGHWQKTTLFENAAHVPLIMAGPGITATSQTAGTPAEMIDLYPTLAELCNLEPPKFLSGVSLVPALRDVAQLPRGSALTHYANGYSIRTQRYRYTEWGEHGNEGVELYDHSVDPEEMNNLFSERSGTELLGKLSRQLQGRVADSKRPPAGIKHNTVVTRRNVPR